MLRKIRIAAAAFFFVLTTLLFLDFTGTLHAWFGWMAKIQFLARPAGPECRRRGVPGDPDAFFSAACTVRSSAAGGDAGHRFVGLREAQKAPEPLRVLPRPHLAAPGDARRVRRCDAGRVSVRCSRLTAPTAASPRTCWPRSTRWATTCWHTSPGAWTATPSIRSTSG